jgi:hypothetical protein
MVERTSVLVSPAGDRPLWPTGGAANHRNGLTVHIRLSAAGWMLQVRLLVVMWLV